MSSKDWFVKLVTNDNFFTKCEMHAKTVNLFDVVSCRPGCDACLVRTKTHVLTIRRCTYFDAVECDDISSWMKVSDVHPYRINSKYVYFLKSRPQPKPPRTMYACCIKCRRTMPSSSYMYCSLSCRFLRRCHSKQRKQRFPTRSSAE